MIECDYCLRLVPVAPHYANVSVSHVVTTRSGALRCPGNEKRRWRADLTHPATALALQHLILSDDRYWEGL